MQILYSFPTPIDRVKNAVFVNRALFILSKASGNDCALETHEICSFQKATVLRGTNFAENYEDPSKFKSIQKQKYLKHTGSYWKKIGM